VSILLIGDSLLDGAFTYLPAAFAAVYPSATVNAEAHVGASTRYWMDGEQIAGFVARYNPTVVVLELGTNDEGAEGDPVAYAGIIARAAAAARSKGGRLVWIGPFNTDAGARARWEIIRRTVGEADAIDGLSLVSGLGRAPDGLHLRMGAYKPFAERMARAIAVRTGAMADSGGTMSVVIPLIVGAGVALLVAWAAGR
jgi:lysophospholipase L1-like esterase